VAQPAIGAVSAGLFKVLASFGVDPDAVAGHSYGELTALFAAKRLNEKDFFDISVMRGRLMNSGKSDRGGMLAVMGKVGMVEAVLSETGLDIVIANKNAPNQVVLSGDKPDLEKVKGVFETRKIRCMSLPVADAFHSRAVSHAADAFHSGLLKVSFSKGEIPVFSNTTGKKYPAAAAAARKRLAYQLAKPVDFMSVIENMYRDGVRTFVEVGPNAVLKGLVTAILGTRAHVCLATDKASSKESGIAGFARVLAHLSAAGYAVDLSQWNLNLKELTVSGKPKMTVPISGVNHVAKREPTPPKSRPSKSRQSKSRPSLISHEEERMGHTTPHTTTEPGGQPVSGVETRKPHTVQAPADQSLDHLQAGMVALQKIQEQTARLHEKFLEGQNAATHMLADLLGRSRPALTTASGARFDESFKTEKAQIPAPEKPLSSELPLEVDDSGEDRCEASPCNRAETPDLRAEISNGAQAHVQKVLLEAISETTGYPVEMLEPDMTLDSDLGIDSIKRVEIFSVLREKLPDAPEIEAKHLGELETLQDIVNHLAATGEARDQGVNSPPVAGPPVVAPAADQKAKEVIVKTLLGAISETTGYPVEMLELDMTLDSDLGIDSIKRVEIFSVLREKLPDAPEIEAKHLGELETLQNIVDHLTPVLSKPGVKKMTVRERERAFPIYLDRWFPVKRLNPPFRRGSGYRNPAPF
jgi:malonyl CoA-acyl carrier protein transacylase/acyl carrier protein